MMKSDSTVQLPHNTDTEAGSFADDPRRQALQRVVESKTFGKSTRLNAFLTYICERTMEGRTAEITEQQIGVFVFGRPTTYNPGEDNIVRTTARQLRQRLALYYHEEAPEETLWIEIPKGAYIPIFEQGPANRIAPAIEEPEAETFEDRSEIVSAAPASQRRTSLFIAAALLIVTGALGAIGVESALHSHSKLGMATDPLWQTLFSSGRQTILVPGDAGVNMYNNLARKQVSIADYISRNYLKDGLAQSPAGYNWPPFVERRYTTIADAAFASRLGQLPNVQPDRFSTRFARDLNISDLKDSNVILLGASTYNPWVQLFESKLNFDIEYIGPTNTMSVLNRHPVHGEVQQYTWSENDPSHLGYAHIALMDNLSDTGKVLIVEGTTMAGVETSTKFLFNDEKMGAIVKQAVDAKGHCRNFEILLQTNMFEGSSSDVKVLAIRVYPQQD